MPKSKPSLTPDDFTDAFFDALNSNNYEEKVVSLMKEYPQYVNQTGGLELRNSAFRNDAQMIKLLVDNGVDINVNDSEALIVAAKHGHYKLVKLLLKLGANVHAHNNKAFKYSMRNRDPHLLKLLLKYYEGNDKQKEKFTIISNDLARNTS